MLRDFLVLLCSRGHSRRLASDNLTVSMIAGCAEGDVEKSQEMFVDSTFKASRNNVKLKSMT